MKYHSGNMTEFHTGLYTKNAYVLCGLVMSNIYRKSYGGIQIKYNNGAVSIDPNGEVVIKALLCDTDWRSHRSIFRSTDQEKRIWFASLLKKMVVADNRYINSPAWERNETRQLTFRCMTDTLVGRLMPDSPYSVEDMKKTIGSFTVQDLYCVYDTLLGRKAATRKYGSDLIKNWIGNEKNPIEAEMEATRRQCIRDITQKYDAQIRDATVDPYYKSYGMTLKGTASLEVYNLYKQMTHEFEKALETAINNATNKWNEKVKELTKARDEEIAAVNESLKFMQI